MLFVFDSFEINMRSKDTQKDILNFINYLSHFEKVKIIICSRTFKQNDLLSQESSSSYLLKSLTSEEMYDFINENGIKGNKYETEELFKITRGHYLLLEFSSFIMQILNISLTIFLSEYKKSARNFLEFLISKILYISSDKFIKLILLLSIIRHGVSADFLINQKFATIEDLDFLLQKHVISEKFGKYYLKDYIKNEFLKTVNTETKIKVYKYLLEVYEAELPLKPFERELFLSRLTMRQEIAYHTKKVEALEEELEKSGKPKLNEIQGFTYLSYSKSSGYNVEAQKYSQKRFANNIKPRSSKNKRFELSNEDSLLLNSSTDNLSKTMQNISNIEQKENEQITIEIPSDKVPDCLSDYLNIAQDYEDAFNFSDAIMYYKKALTYTLDEMFNVKEPIIYTKLAICYKKIQDFDNSIKLYEKVYELYLKNAPDKANEILLAIAQIYSEVYKFDKAKEVYKRILYSPVRVSSEMVVRVYLDLSEIEDNNLEVEESIKYVQKALSTAEKLSNNSLLCECYFKYALILDDTNNLDLALKYYLRCVQTSNNPDENMFLSSAYANLAEISQSSKNFAAVKMYYELSIEADKHQNNFEGLYYSYSKLAQLYKNEDIEKTYEYLVKALSAAKKLDDIAYCATIYIEIGDYYLSIENYKQAVKSYILAKNLLPQHSAEDLQTKINIKINKIKMMLGDIEFMKIMTEIKNKK
jgi:tetratricopeptide (TPR) repeat protein